MEVVGTSLSLLAAVTIYINIVQPSEIPLLGGALAIGPPFFTHLRWQFS